MRLNTLKKTCLIIFGLSILEANLTHLNGEGVKKMSPTLPDYVVLKDMKSPGPQVLRQEAQEVQFPLSQQDQEIIRTLEAKFDQEENCAGLAAPQIGIGKKIIVFAVTADEELKKWRPDLTETMPKTIWINPTYEPIGEEKHADFEACFSVYDIGGQVERYKRIRYKAYLPNGTKVEGEASGFLARVIQHEIDHVHGKLFVDRTSPDTLFSIEEYRQKRAKATSKE